MTKGMLTTGTICVLRKGTVCVVLPNEDAAYGLSLYGKANDGGVVRCKKHVSHYTDDLKATKEANDIVAVLLPGEGKYDTNTLLKHVYGVAEDELNMADFKWDWTETPVIPARDMTIAKIEEVLGFPINIVESHDEYDDLI